MDVHPPKNGIFFGINSYWSIAILQAEDIATTAWTTLWPARRDAPMQFLFLVCQWPGKLRCNITECDWHLFPTAPCLSHDADSRAQGTKEKIKPVAESNPNKSQTDRRQIIHVMLIQSTWRTQMRLVAMRWTVSSEMFWRDQIIIAKSSKELRDDARCVSFIKLPNVFQSSHRDILSQCLFTCLPANITATMVISTTTTTTTTTATITSTVQALAELCLQLPQPQNLWLSLEYRQLDWDC